MSTTVANPHISNTCVNCGASLISGKPFCADCGRPNGAPPDLATMQAYVDGKVTAELSAKLKEQQNVVRELADKAEDVVWNRLKRYSVIVGFFLVVIVGLVTFIGFKTYGDLKASVVQQVQPSVIAVEQRIKQVDGELAEVERNRIPAVTQSLNKVERDAASQEKRVTEADGQIADSMQSLHTAEAKANADSAAFSQSVLENQRKLDQITQRSREQISQITASASKAAITQAYGFIAEKPPIVIAGQTISKESKRPGEKWINLVVSLDAIHHQTYTTAQLEKVEAALLAAGYRVFIGTISVGGRFAIGLERVQPNGEQDTAVIYFDRTKQSEAEQLRDIVNKELPASKCAIQLLGDVDNGNFHAEAIRYFGDNSGIDAQVFLGSRPGK